MRAHAVLTVLALLVGSAASAPAAPRAKARPAPTQTAGAPSPAVTQPSGTRHPVANELTELARTALASSLVRLPKGATLLAARPSAASNVEIPVAPSRISIDLTQPARRVGPVTATAVLVFWKDADGAFPALAGARSTSEVSARIPLHLDLSVPPEALVYDVPKGGAVTLVVRRGLVEVTTQAVAAADADIGDVVQVLLRPSGRALRAQIVAKDRAVAVEDGR
jgi:hypothetical protein